MIHLEYDPTERPRGRTSAVADSEMGQAGAFMAIGGGPGDAGMFGAHELLSHHPPRALCGGGNVISERVWCDGLTWLESQRLPEAGWPIDTHGSFDQVTTSVAIQAFMAARRQAPWKDRWLPIILAGTRRLLAKEGEGLASVDVVSQARILQGILAGTADISDSESSRHLLSADFTEIVRHRVEAMLATAIPGDEGLLVGWSSSPSGSSPDPAATMWSTCAIWSAVDLGLATDPPQFHLDRLRRSLDRESLIGADRTGSVDRLRFVALAHVMSSADDGTTRVLLRELHSRRGEQDFTAERTYLDALAAHNVQNPLIRYMWKNALYRGLCSRQERAGAFKGSWSDETIGRVRATATCCLALAILWTD